MRWHKTVSVCWGPPPAVLSTTHWCQHLPPPALPSSQGLRQDIVAWGEFATGGVRDGINGEGSKKREMGPNGYRNEELKECIYTTKDISQMNTKNDGLEKIGSFQLGFILCQF